MSLFVTNANILFIFGKQYLNILLNLAKKTSQSGS